VLLEVGWKEVMMMSLLKPEGNNWDSCVKVLEKSVAYYLGGDKSGRDEFYKGVCGAYERLKLIIPVEMMTFFNIRGF